MSVGLTPLRFLLFLSCACSCLVYSLFVCASPFPSPSSPSPSASPFASASSSNHLFHSSSPSSLVSPSLSSPAPAHYPTHSFYSDLALPVVQSLSSPSSHTFRIPLVPSHCAHSLAAFGPSLSSANGTLFVRLQRNDGLFHSSFSSEQLVKDSKGEWHTYTASDTARYNCHHRGEGWIAQGEEGEGEEEGDSEGAEHTDTGTRRKYVAYASTCNDVIRIRSLNYWRTDFQRRKRASSSSSSSPHIHEIHTNHPDVGVISLHLAQLQQSGYSHVMYRQRVNMDRPLAEVEHIVSRARSIQQRQKKAQHIDRSRALHLSANGMVRNSSSSSSSRSLLSNPYPVGSDLNPYYLSVMVFNDYQRCHLLFADDIATMEANTLSILNIVDALYYVNHFTPAIRWQVYKQLSFPTGDPYGPPAYVTYDPYDAKNSIVWVYPATHTGSLFTVFDNWRVNQADIGKYGQAMLLSGYRFNGVDGISDENYICYGTSVIEGMDYTIYGLPAEVNHVALTTAHEFGHTLSLQHDGQYIYGTDSCVPSQSNYYIMATSVSPYYPLYPYFSNCSQAEWRNRSTQGFGSCVYTVATLPTTPAVPSRPPAVNCTVCVDTGYCFPSDYFLSSNYSCGSCSNWCTQNATCVNGVCQCYNPAMEFCNGHCVARGSAYFNSNQMCGSCNTQCVTHLDGTSCLPNPQANPPLQPLYTCQCPSYQTLCSAGSLNLVGICHNTSSFQTDMANCGGCGMSCYQPNAVAQSCISGQCSFTCNYGYGDCDHDYSSNGCETYLLTNSSNCGTTQCGHACAANQYCRSGVCTAIPSSSLSSSVSSTYSSSAPSGSVSSSHSSTASPSPSSSISSTFSSFSSLSSTAASLSHTPSSTASPSSSSSSSSSASASSSHSPSPSVSPSVSHSPSPSPSPSPSHSSSSSSTGSHIGSSSSSSLSSRPSSSSFSLSPSPSSSSSPSSSTASSSSPAAGAQSSNTALFSTIGTDESLIMAGAGVVGLLALIGLVYWAYRRREKRAQNARDLHITQICLTDTLSSAPSPSAYSTPLSRASPSFYEPKQDVSEEGRFHANPSFSFSPPPLPPAHFATRAAPDGGVNRT